MSGKDIWFQPSRKLSAKETLEIWGPNDSQGCNCLPTKFEQRAGRDTRMATVNRIVWNDANELRNRVIQEIAIDAEIAKERGE